MNLASNCSINLPVLLETRALIQANSGGGKSYALRRLLEQTAPHVQQLIIDPEGEFATLREKFDYVICSPHGGDALAHPKTAAVLARRLLETGVSAVLDIYDLKAHERQSFVRLFLDALVNAPRELWRPVMVVLDEAHVFCPQTGSAEASQAVIDIATRGRKRGQCLVLATQRLSKLHKDTAAEMLNKLIGRTSLDVDVKRAADEIGSSYKEALLELRSLVPGWFVAFGPGFKLGTGNAAIERIKIGPVVTSHPKAGDRLLKAPPAPSPAVRAQLARLGDLQKEAEHEARTIDELKAEIAKLKREAKKPAVDEGALKLHEEVRRRMVMAEAKANGLERIVQKATELSMALSTQLRGIPMPGISKEELAEDVERRKRMQARAEAEIKSAADFVNGPVPTKGGTRGIELVGERASPVQSYELRSGALRILRELAARHPAGYTKAQVGALTKFSHKGGTFNTYLSDLRRAGFVKEGNNALYATDAGLAQFGDKPPAATTHEEAMAMWGKALRSGAYKMLQQIVEAREDGLHRANLADLVGMTAAGGTFNTYLSDLRRNGLIVERGKRLVANDILFP